MQEVGHRAYCSFCFESRVGRYIFVVIPVLKLSFNQYSLPLSSSMISASISPERRKYMALVSLTILKFVEICPRLAFFSGFSISGTSTLITGSLWSISGVSDDGACQCLPQEHQKHDSLFCFFTTDLHLGHIAWFIVAGIFRSFSHHQRENCVLRHSTLGFYTYSAYRIFR